MVIEASVSNENVENDAVAVVLQIKPEWTKENIQFKLFTDGITNKLVGIFQKDAPEDILLMRIYGNNTHLLIDRTAEKSSFRTLTEAGLAPRLLAEFNNGLAYEYVKGVTTTVQTIKEPQIYSLVAKNMARFHKVHSNMKQSKVWNKTKHILGLIPQEYACPKKQERFQSIVPGGINQLKTDLSHVEQQLSKTKSPVVFCHNDLLMGNIIYDQEKQKVTFIDYEYVYVNYQAFDIANHFDEFAGIAPIDHSKYPSQEFQLSWLRIYLEEYLETPPSTQQLSTLHWQVQQFSPFAHLCWTIWGFVQAHHSDLDFDFLDYAQGHYEGYQLKKKYLSSMES